MENDGAKVVILGKGKDKTSRDIQELITGINPTHIPIVILDGVYVVENNNKRTRIAKKLMDESIVPMDIEKYIRTTGIPPKDIKQIEIIIDLDKTKNTLDTKISEVFTHAYKA